MSEAKEREGINSRWVVNLKGKDYLTYPGVLDLAHRSGLRNIEVNLEQIPSAENGQLAVAHAIATFEDGRIFTEVGDASPANCSPQIAAAACRMAATRAKGRALRDALNIGEALLEEIDPLHDREDGPRNAPEPATTPRARYDPKDTESRRPTAAPGTGPSGTWKPALAGQPCANCGKPVPPAVVSAAIKEFNEPLCIPCGKERRARRNESDLTEGAQEVEEFEARMKRDQAAFQAATNAELRT